MTPRSVSFQGLTTRFLVTGDDAALIEHELAPHALGAPVHTHEHEDETSHVLAGTLGVELGGETLTLTAGDTLRKPRGVPHTFWNAGDEPVRFLEVVTPGAFAGYFEDVAPVLDRPGPPDVATLGAIAGRYGLAMEPETIGRLAEAHALELQA